MLRRWLRRAPHRPTLSFIVVAYNMQREAVRTLRSLARTYQRDSEEVDYEVVVVDNGSTPPLDLSRIGDIDAPVRLFYRDDARVSPADAVNFGVARSCGDYVAVMIDGARMLTPGVVRGVHDALALAEQPVVTVLGLHLGPGHQRDTVSQGYSKAVEDQLLASIDWPARGDRLFEIGAWGGSCPAGWLGRASESNCIVVSRTFYDQLGGYDERFRLPGGGLVNLDFYKRAVEYPGATLICLAGEGCFHQLHGGVTTSERGRAYTFDELNEEYRQLRGENFTAPQVQPLLHGRLQLFHGPALLDAANKAMERHALPTVRERCAPFMETADKPAGEQTRN